MGSQAFFMIKHSESKGDSISCHESGREQESDQP